MGEHGDGIGWRGEEFGVGADEFAEEDLRVGERTAGGGVGGDGADCGEGLVDGLRRGLVLELDDELDGADAVERGDGAAGDDGERRA